MHLRLTLLMTALVPLHAAEWSCAIPGAPAAKAEVCTFKYGKEWAYAVEIDDGPKWARPFAVPFLAQYHWTDAPPGVKGGTQRPFVGGIAVIVGAINGSDQALSWADLDAMEQSGWGVINHSLSHNGRSWGDDKGRLSDDQVREDAFWSQAMLANGLASKRAPTACVYANGYTDYNRGGALAAVGIRIATRVSGSSPNDVTNPGVQWMDFNRNYLDEGPWKNDQKGEPLSGIPDAAGAGPKAGSFIIDFTHGIEQQDGNENNARWKTRLSTIASRWGAGGRDNLWCAPTGEIADYVQAAKVATVTCAKGTLTVSLPDGQPGTALTVRLTGVPAAAKLAAPAGGTLYRQGDVAWLTTPVLGLPGSTPTTPRIKPIYTGVPGLIDLKGSRAIAGIAVRMGGHAPDGFAYTVVAKTANGDVLVSEAKPDFSATGGWVNGQVMHAVVPTRAAIQATAVDIPRVDDVMREVTVWVVDEAAPTR